MPTTSTGDTIPKETDDSIESEQDTQDDSVVLAQLTVNPLFVPLTPSTNPLIADDPSTQDAVDQGVTGIQWMTPCQQHLQATLFLKRLTTPPSQSTILKMTTSSLLSLP